MTIIHGQYKFDISESEWRKKFKPIKNPLNEGGVFGDATFFETNDKDFEFIKSQNPLTVGTDIWTEDGYSWIVSGIHFTNRMGYYVTEIPFPENKLITALIYAPENDEDGGEEDE